MCTLFKKDLVDQYAELKGITKIAALERIDDVLGLIERNLIEGKNVKLNNFFNFFVKSRNAKEAVNPKTGEPMVIPATRTVHAKMTKPFKDKIQGKR